MFKAVLLCSTLLITGLAVDAANGAQKAQTAIPNLASATFGWAPDTFLRFDPVPSKIAPTGAGPDIPGIERLGDENNPNLTPWAAAQIRMNNDLVRKGHRAFAAQSRCWPGGTPGQLLFLQPVYFIQMPDEVWMIWERDHQVRRIYLNREHSHNPAPSWFGESVGHYENGELVVDTIGVVDHPLSFVDYYTTPHTKNLHVVERFRPTDGGNGLEATVTVDDPGAFKAPWSGKVIWEKTDHEFAEWACAENNLGYEQFFDLPEYPMPVANVRDF